MTPNIYRLIVKHKERFTQLTFTVEVYPVPPLNVLVIYQVVGRFFYMTHEGLEFYFALVAHFLQFVHALVEFIEEPLAIIMVLPSMWFNIFIMPLIKYILRTIIIMLFT